MQDFILFFSTINLSPVEQGRSVKMEIQLMWQLLHQSSELGWGEYLGIKIIYNKIKLISINVLIFEIWGILSLRAQIE